MDHKRFMNNKRIATFAGDGAVFALYQVATYHELYAIGSSHICHITQESIRLAS